ncbi:DUF2804 domain-containing protein [Alkanindiges sp. WGS2144]|uniref:DUF2804 domain-containing protein n=1 Tax=Alkanindiges sp. WGS2144 TaxID=3366808 RepID=UPI00375021C8
MKHLFERGKPQYGRFKQAPQCIDIQQFNYQTPFKRSITGLTKNLHFKQFQFISLNNERYMIGLAVVDLGWVGHGFFYCHDQHSGQVREFSYLQAFAKNTHVCSHQIGTTFFKKGRFLIQIKKEWGIRRVLVQQGQKELLNATISTNGVEPLALCTPTGVSGWTFTQKQATLAAQGSVCFKRQSIDLGEQRFMAAIDETCGMLRPETAWHWLSLSGVDQQGQRLGINLATGVNETFSTENSLWLDGKISELPPVLFEQIAPDQWRIFSADGRVDLQVKTAWRRHESKNFIVVASQFSQWVSFISGRIQYNDSWIEISPQMGLLEQHYAKW